MKLVVRNENVVTALKRVKQNKGSPGIDGMTVEELQPYLRENWREIRQELLEGSYRPKPVKRQQIPKDGGGVRELGIPKLRINDTKSAVAPGRERKFLGFSFWIAPGRVFKPRVASKALAKMKARVRDLTARNRGRSIRQVVTDLRSYLAGWKNYFKLAQTPRIFSDLDEWIRHRLRALHLKHWKRGKTIFRRLRARGVSVDVAAQVAANARRWWHNSKLHIHLALPNRYFDELGVLRLAA